MTRLRFYQLSLRGMFVLTAVAAGGLWLCLWWVGRIAPQRGETVVTAREQRILREIAADHSLTYIESPYIPIFT